MSAYLDAYLVTGKADYARVATECGDVLLSWMTDPAGGITAPKTPTNSEAKKVSSTFGVRPKSSNPRAEHAGEICEVKNGVTDLRELRRPQRPSPAPLLDAYEK